MELKLLHTRMILAFINVNNMGSHNVRTHWVYFYIINIDLRRETGTGQQVAQLHDRYDDDDDDLRMVWWNWNM